MLSVPLIEHQPEQLPALRLARMGADEGHEGNGLGAALLKHFMLKHFMLKVIEVAGSVDVRLLVVHTENEHAKSSYPRYGFTESPVDPLTMMMMMVLPKM